MRNGDFVQKKLYLEFVPSRTLYIQAWYVYRMDSATRKYRSVSYTHLAWIRTALGFLAAGVGLDQLAPDFATPVIRELLALLLCLFSGGLAMYGYLRWLRNEKAMRLKEDLPYTNSLLIISLILMVVAVIVMGLVLYAG